MGMPLSEEWADGSGGAAIIYSDFERGSIWFTSDGGARVLFGLVIEFVGFHCFGEQVDLGSDELYFEVDAGPLNPPLEDPRRIDDGMWFTFLPADGRPVYEGVDSRETVQDTRPVYIGRAVPLIVRTRMWEHDHGDPNALRHQIKTAVAAAGTVTAAFVPAASSIATDPNVQATVTNVLNGIVGTDDDFLGQGEFRLASRRDILKTLNTPPHNEHGILLQHKIFLTDQDASYDAYFTVRPWEPN
jgi:hypothetical protein